VLIAAEKVKIELQNVPPLIDFTEIANKGVEQGAEAREVCCRSGWGQREGASTGQPDIPGT
jgi:hypothetical protein